MAHPLSLRLLHAGWLLVSVLLRSIASPARQPTPLARPTQAQIARQFLTEVLLARYPAAYQRLAPEVRATLRPVAFAAAARPLWRAGQQRGSAVELYKLGTRLTGRSGRWFYSFSFAADSARRPPPALLEVTFRDTTSRAVLGFSLRQR